MRVTRVIQGKGNMSCEEFVCENKASVPSPKCVKKYGRGKVNTDVSHSDLRLHSGKR